MPSMFTLFFLNTLLFSLSPLFSDCNLRTPAMLPAFICCSHFIKSGTPPPPSLEFQLRGFKVSGSVVGGVGRVGGGHQTCRVLQASEDSQGPLLKGAGQLTNP